MYMQAGEYLIYQNINVVIVTINNEHQRFDYIKFYMSPQPEEERLGQGYN